MIPRTIGKEELLVRGILSPLFFSSRKLKSLAFLPPPNKTDVSLLRHAFTNDDFCKSHSLSLKITNQTYCGLATFLAQHIEEVNKNGGCHLTITLKSTPLDTSYAIISNGDVFKSDPGLPMHADLVYSQPPVKGQVSTNHRMVADLILKISNYFPDPEGNAESTVWKGKKLSWEPTENNLGPKIQIRV